MTDPTGTIPQSTALSEASPESIGDLMGMDPEGEGFAKAIPRIVQELRAQRARWDAGQGSKAKKAPKASGPSVLDTKMISSEDLGF